MSLLSAKRSLSFSGRGLLSGPRTLLNLRGPLVATRCHKSSHGTVLMEPAKKSLQHKRPVHAPPQLQPLVRQPVRRKRYMVDSPAKLSQKKVPQSDLERTVGRVPAKGKQMAKQAVNAGAAASESVQQLVPNKAFPFIKHAGQQTAEGLHKPIGLVLASAYLLGTICHLSGTQTGLVHMQHCALCLCDSPHLASRSIHPFVTEGFCIEGCHHAQALRLAQNGCQQ